MALHTGFTEKVIWEGEMANANGVDTSTIGEPEGAELNGPEFNEYWEYNMMVVMLMYSAWNTRPDNIYAVHLDARFSYNPKNSHDLAIKWFLRHIQ